MFKRSTLATLLAIVVSKAGYCYGDDYTLCNDNPNICKLEKGRYRDGNNRYMNWWAYIPQGELACDTGGCPLYIWLDGSFDSNTHQRRDDIMQYEMLKRGFVAVTVGYDDSLLRPSMACDTTRGFLGKSQGLLDKAKAIFDENNDASAVSQLCDMVEVNCDMGIATHGFSQGAQLASLGKLLYCSTHHMYMHILTIILLCLIQEETSTLEFLPVSCMVMATHRQRMVTFHV